MNPYPGFCMLYFRQDLFAQLENIIRIQLSRICRSRSQKPYTDLLNYLKESGSRLISEVDPDPIFPLTCMLFSQLQNRIRIQADKQEGSVTQICFNLHMQFFTPDLICSTIGYNPDPRWTRIPDIVS